MALPDQKQTIQKSDLVAERSYLPGDKNFILATSLRGLYYGDTWMQDIPKDVFMSNYHRVIEHLLDAPGTKVKVACLKDDPEVILGYAMYREAAGITVLDFLYVKTAWRRIGIAKGLMPKKIDAYTHQTKLWKAIKPAGCIFNPFLI